MPPIVSIFFKKSTAAMEDSNNEFHSYIRMPVELYELYVDSN